MIAIEPLSEGGWKAYLVAKPDVWTYGPTQYEAVYHLVRMLGLLGYIKHTKEAPNAPQTD